MMKKIFLITAFMLMASRAVWVYPCTPDLSYFNIIQNEITMDNLFGI